MSKGVTSVVELVGAVVAAYFGQYQLAASLAAAALQTEHAARQEIAAKNAYNASLRNRYASFRGTMAPRQLVFGRCRVSGPMFFAASYGSDKQHLSFCIALAAHELDDIETIYFDDRPIILDGSGNVTGVLAQDAFSIAAATATVTITKTPTTGSVTASARYGDVVVPLTVTSVTGVSVSVSGARVGQTGELDVFYQPNPDPYAPSGLFARSVQFAITSNSQTFTLPSIGPHGAAIPTPDATGVHAVYVATSPDSDDAFPVTVSLVSGYNVTCTGMTIGRTVALYYQTSEGPTKARVRKYLGAPGQAADSGLITNYPGVWTSAHTATGIAYLVVELDYDQDAFIGGVPNVSAVVRGMKCYDPRTGTTAWTENPALHIRALATHSLAGALPTASIDDASISAAANVCDTTATYTVGTAAFVRALYKAGYAWTADQKPIDGIHDLCEAMGGDWVFADGKLRVSAGAYVTPNTLTLDETWLSDDTPVQVQVEQARLSLVNTITASIADSLQDYRVVPLPRLAPSAYLTTDGASLPQSIQYAAVTFSGQAQYLASCALRRMRQGLGLVVRCNYRAWQIERFDVVNVTLSRFGWTNKPFEVLSDTWTEDGSIELTLRETSSTIWDMDAGFSAVDLAPNTDMPAAWGLPTVAGLVATTGDSTLLRQLDGTVVPRISLTWTAATDSRVLAGGYIEIRYWRMGDSSDTYQTVKTVGTDSQAFLNGVRAGSQYMIIARTASVVTQSPWCSQILSVVSGKSDAPPDLTGLTATVVYGAVFLTWNQPANTDYAQTELRVGASWAAGVPLKGSTPTVIRGLSHLWAWPALASYTVWAKQIDTSGNPSNTAVSVAVTVDARINIHDGAVGLTTAFALTQAKHTPDFETFRDSVVSVTYTPTLNCDAVLTVSGSGTYGTSSTNNTVFVLGGIYISGAFPSGSTPIDCLKKYSVPGTSSADYFGISGTRTFTLTAGTTYVFKFLACKWVAGDTCTIDNIEMRLDVLKGV